MFDASSTVLVIDDDPDLRASVGRLLRSLGIDVQLFASISEFLKSDPPDGPTCLVLDVRLPGQSGLDLQRELAQAKRELPIIFISGHGDIPMSVQAMKGGAIEFLTKPFRDQDLLDAIQLSLSRDRAWRENEKALADLRDRFAALSPREREIVIQVARGRLSKQIAFDIGIARMLCADIGAMRKKQMSQPARWRSPIGAPQSGQHGLSRWLMLPLTGQTAPRCRSLTPAADATPRLTRCGRRRRGTDARTPSKEPRTCVQKQ